jgi:plastocyanin
LLLPTLAPSQRAQLISVEIKDITFEPTSITVEAGTTVTLTNGAPLAHTANATDDPVTFNSGNFAPGASFSYTFDEAATIPYLCIYHPNIRAALMVE